jgi:very-short-patch-repair endonuclease
MCEKNRDCLECGVYIKSNSDNSLHRLFLNHIKTHGITHEEYVIKHFLNGVKPLCLCGCNNEVKFHKGKHHKYYGNHKNFVKPNNNIKIKAIENRKKNLDIRLKEINLTTNQLIESYNNFTNLDISLSDLSRNLGIDYRTIKKYWNELGLIINQEIFNRICKKSKTLWLKNIVKPNEDDYEDLLNKNNEIEKFLKSSNDKRTIGEIIRIFDLNVNYNYFLNYIQENYDKNLINKTIKLHNQSQIEIEFYNILRFYYGNKVKKQFPLDGKDYDYKLGNKILIELDGEYWHSFPDSIQNDKIKNKIAKDNGFIIFRVTDKEIKDINVLFKIKELYEKFK